MNNDSQSGNSQHSSPAYLHDRLRTQLLEHVWNQSGDNMFLIRPEQGEYYMVKANIAERTSFELLTPLPKNQPLREFLPADIYQRVAANYQRCIDAGEAIHYEEEETITSHNGSVRYWRTNLTPLFAENGEIEYLFGISRDVTSLKHAREQIEKNQQIKTSLLSGIGEQLHQPLASMREALAELRTTSDEVTRQRLLDTLEQAQYQLQNHSSDLLDFTSIDNQQLELADEPFSVHDICAQVGQLLQPEAQKKHLTLTINTDSAIPPLVYGDGPRLQQIMLNLLRNAIRFSRHGEVSLSASLDRRSGLDHQLRFVIRDNSGGIHHDDLNKVFHPFSRLRHHETETHTDLSLKLSHDLVRAKRGNIQVSSEAGKGSVFEVELSYPAVPA